MTKEELQYRTSIQAAYLEGQPIQVRYRNEFKPKWIDTPTPGFDWEHYDYRIKSVTWRAAKNRESYWFITSSGVAICTKDARFSEDDARYAAGNYFASQEDAEAAAKKIKQLLIELREV